MAVPGLAEALAVAGLEGHVSVAADWCQNMGARDLEEIGEEEVFADFADSLHLKPLEKRRLRKALAGPSAAPPTPQAAAEAGLKPPSAPAQPHATGHTVFVKNTFLDLEDNEAPRSSELRRLATAPAPGLAHEDSEETDEVADEMTAPATRVRPVEGLYKTGTCDGYDSWDQWCWLTGGGDPNAGTGVAGEQGESVEPTAPLGDAMVMPEYMDPSLSGPVGMVMVPTEAMYTPYVLPQPGMCFPGMTLVPMDRFDRWPVGMQPGEVPEAKKPDQTLQKAFSVASSIYRVRWTVDARKLKTKDREAASPTFELTCGVPMQFKMVIHPRKVEDARGGASFKKAQGRGSVQLRILTGVEASSKAVVTFRIAVGSPLRQEKPRGPVRHDFAERPICGLPAGIEEWDFQKVIDKTTQTFVVCLEVLTGPGD